MDLERLRKKIDEIDDQILGLLNARAEVVKEVGKSKAKSSMAYYDPGREERILNRLQKINRGPFPASAVRSVFREIISASLSLEKPIRIAYLGPEATFTHIAALKKFGLSASLTPMLSLTRVFSAVERDQADYGVVPMENSTEGVAIHTLDLFIDSELKTCTEIIFNIQHDLLAQHSELDKIERVYAHPQSIVQCSEWLRENLPNRHIIEVPSTFRAVELVKEDAAAALIAEETLRELYRLHTVRKKIEDNTDNFARFLVLWKGTSAPTGDDQTSLLFSMKDQIGALSLLLQPFAQHQVSLRRIESRPIPNRPWESVFLVDFDGHIQEDRVARLLEDLKVNCDFFKILGSYPKSKLNAE